MSWEEAWREQRTPWDAGASPPILEKLVQEGEIPNGRALVPGCGSGYDVLTLATESRSVLGIDLAEGARQRFAELRERRGVPSGRAEVRTADFFELDPPSPFDMVWDYTFLCAIEPDMRLRWAEKMHELIAPGGELVTLIFPIRSLDERPGPDVDGPPYPMHPELVRDLLEGRFENLVLEPVKTSHEGREGMEWLGRWRPL
ncbi:MAG: methyltransferase domain-containing protein [Myxococcota bacterium]